MRSKNAFAFRFVFLFLVTVSVASEAQEKTFSLALTETDYRREPSSVAVTLLPVALIQGLGVEDHTLSVSTVVGGFNLIPAPVPAQTFFGSSRPMGTTFPVNPFSAP